MAAYELGSESKHSVTLGRMELERDERWCHSTYTVNIDFTRCQQQKLELEHIDRCGRLQSSYVQQGGY